MRVAMVTCMSRALPCWCLTASLQYHLELAGRLASLPPRPRHPEVCKPSQGRLPACVPPLLSSLMGRLHRTHTIGMNVDLIGQCLGSACWNSRHAACIQVGLQHGCWCHHIAQRPQGPPLLLRAVWWVPPSSAAPAALWRSARGDRLRQQQPLPAPLAAASSSQNISTSRRQEGRILVQLGVMARHSRCLGLLQWPSMAAEAGRMGLSKCCPTCCRSLGLLPAGEAQAAAARGTGGMQVRRA